MKPPQGQSWQFRDQRVPARIVHLLRDDKIFVRDLLLMFAIDSLVKPQGEEDGIGCFASNSYLAKVVKANTTYVSERLNILKKMSLVVIITLKGRRYLELEWSRTAEEVWEVAGEYGNALRKARRLVRNACSDSAPAEPPPSAPAEPPPSAPAEPEYSKEEDLKSLKSNCRLNGGKVCDTLIPSGENGKGRSPGRRLADELYKGLRIARKYKRSKPPDLHPWGKIFDDHISVVVDCYNLTKAEAVERLSNQIGIHVSNINGEWWPQACSAKTFCDDVMYSKIERAIARLEQDKARQAEKDQREHLRQLAVIAEEESGYHVDDFGNIQIEYNGKWKTIPRQDEDDLADLYINTKKYAEYIRNQRKS